MVPKIVESGPKLSEKDLAGLEKEFGVKLPASYRAFLLKHNGGGPEPKYFSIEDPRSSSREAGLEWFYAVKSNVLTTISTAAERYKRRLSEELIPIGTDAGGSQVCIAVAGKKPGAVHFWDSMSRKTYLVAGSFDEFIKSFFDEIDLAPGIPFSAEQKDMLRAVGLGPPEDCLLSDDLRDENLIDSLIAQGANVNATWPDREQNTPLQRAAAAGDVEVCRILIENGAKLNAKDVSGRTALHHAAKAGRAKVVQILMEAGANAKLKDMDGKRASDLAKGSAIRSLLDGAKKK